METTEAAARWARIWHDAWQAQDTDAVVTLYAPSARFSTQAFREPHHGQEGVRQYVERAFSEERDPRVWVGEPIVTEDRAAIEWWAAVVENDAEITLAGVSVLRFDRGRARDRAMGLVESGRGAPRAARRMGAGRTPGLKRCTR